MEIWPPARYWITQKGRQVKFPYKFAAITCIVVGVAMAQQWAAKQVALKKVAYGGSSPYSLMTFPNRPSGQHHRP
jgi:hypothetical protein